MVDVLIIIVLSLFSLILGCAVGMTLAFFLRKMRKEKRQEGENASEMPLINFSETPMSYSIESVQPEMKASGDVVSNPDQTLFEKPKMQRRLFESILSSQVDSADEMSFISLSEAENDQRRKTKAIDSRFAKYLENVPGIEPMILVSLHYHKEKEHMELAIIKVANLQLLSNNKKPDPHVRVDVWIRNILLLKKKTIVMKQELNPVYNQKMQFHVSGEDLENIKIILTVANNASSQSNRLKGRRQCLHEVVFGIQSTGSLLAHWNAAITTYKPTAKWHVFKQLYQTT